MSPCQVLATQPSYQYHQSVKLHNAITFQMLHRIVTPVTLTGITLE